MIGEKSGVTRLRYGAVEYIGLIGSGTGSKFDVFTRSKACSAAQSQITDRRNFAKSLLAAKLELATGLHGQ